MTPPSLTETMSPRRTIGLCHSQGSNSDMPGAGDQSIDLVVRFTNNVVVGPFLYPTQQELRENAATRVLASSACLVE